MTAVLGLDVGGTHSRGLLFRDGKEVARANAPSASLTVAGPIGSADALGHLMKQLDLGPGAGLDAICVGTAGSGSDDAETFYVAALAPFTAGGRVVVVNDGRLQLAASGLTDGIACVAGTGSIVIGLLAGREHKVGGWGYLLGDEGGGYWTVREAVRELLLRQEKGQGLGDLGRAVLAGSMCACLEDLVQAWHERPQPGAWAALAPSVLGCHDPFALTLHGRAAAALAATVKRAHELLGSPAGLPVVLGGGLLSGRAELAGEVRDRLDELMPGSPCSVVTQAPVAGAVRLALESVGK